MGQLLAEVVETLSSRGVALLDLRSACQQDRGGDTFQVPLSAGRVRVAGEDNLALLGHRHAAVE